MVLRRRRLFLNLLSLCLVLSLPSFYADAGFGNFAFSRRKSTSPAFAYRSVAEGALPPGVQTGDLMVAAAIDTSSMSAPAGWTRIGTEQTPGSTYVSFFYRFRQAGDTFPTFSSAWNTYVIVGAFINVSSSAPLYAVSTTEVSTANPTLPSLTASGTAGDAAIYMAIGESGIPYAPPTDYTEAFDNGYDETLGYRLNLSASQSTSGTLTVAASNKGLLHLILKKAP